jgi:hypothetical protein
MTPLLESVGIMAVRRMGALLGGAGGGAGKGGGFAGGSALATGAAMALAAKREDSCLG